MREWDLRIWDLLLSGCDMIIIIGDPILKTVKLCVYIDPANWA